MDGWRCQLDKIGNAVVMMAFFIRWYLLRCLSHCYCSLWSKVQERGCAHVCVAQSLIDCIMWFILSRVSAHSCVESMCSIF